MKDNIIFDEEFEIQMLNDKIKKLKQRLIAKFIASLIFIKAKIQQEIEKWEAKKEAESK